MKLSELPIPPPIASDKNARELLRVWAAHGRQHISIATEVWDDPAAWGIMLVDLAKHIARSYQERENVDAAQTLKRIKEGFDAEWATCTDKL